MLKLNRLSLSNTSLGVLLFVCSSCSNDVCCTFIDLDVAIHYKNQSGENLINSSDDFASSNIKIYYKNGDEYEYYYKANLDAPNMHQLNEDNDGRLVLQVFASNYYEDNLSTTLIELNPNIVDTLVCEFDLGKNKEAITRAWFNGVEMQDRFIEVVK